MLSVAPIRWNDPATWPWMFYVWAAFAFAGLAKPAWNWFRRQRAGGWPTAEGRIESVEITKPSFSFTTKRGYSVSELGYSYSVAGTPYSGRYKRDFPTGELRSRLDQTLPLVFRFPFCDWSPRQSVDSSRSGDGTPRGTGSFFLDVGCRNLHRVAPSRPSGAAARW